MKADAIAPDTESAISEALGSVGIENALSGGTPVRLKLRYRKSCLMRYTGPEWRLDEAATTTSNP